MPLRSPRGASAATLSMCLSTGMDSPVSADSSQRNSLTCSSRRSAGTRSPEASSTTSPGTRPAASISWRWPSRSTTACGDSMARMASSADSALPSCTKPMAALTSTAASSTPVSTQCPRKAVTTAAASMTYSSTLWNCSSRRSQALRRGAACKRFGPCWDRRCAACAAASPWGWLSSAARACSAGCACQGGAAGGQSGRGVMRHQLLAPTMRAMPMPPPAAP